MNEKQKENVNNMLKKANCFLEGIDKSFDNFFKDMGITRLASEAFINTEADLKKPMSDKKDNKHTYYFDMPGVSKEEIKISVKDNILSISAENIVESLNHKIYNFTVKIDDNYIEDKITSKLENGVLSVYFEYNEECDNVININIE